MPNQEEIDYALEKGLGQHSYLLCIGRYQDIKIFSSSINLKSKKSEEYSEKNHKERTACHQFQS
jgi:hypothetical protein